MVSIANGEGVSYTARWSNLVCLMIGLLVSVPAVSAQDLLGPDYVPVAQRIFERDQNLPPLRCDIVPVQPALDFSLRFHTGYTIHFPMNQFHGPNHRAHVVVRVTPTNGTPVYLVNVLEFPQVPDMILSGQSGGDFVVGEGTYTVEALVEDDQQRVCRSQWQLQARRGLKDRGFRMATPPSTVAMWPSIASSSIFTESSEGGRLTVLLNAASLVPSATSLRDSDVLTLVGSLSSVLEQLPSRAVSLVVFNLEQQKVLFRDDAFTASDVFQVTKVIRELQLGGIDYSVLQKSDGGVGFLKQLTQEAFSKSIPSDTLVFVGPHVQTRGAVSNEAVKELQGGPRVFYLECRPPVSLLGMYEQVYGPSENTQVHSTDAGEYFTPRDAATILLPTDDPDTIEHLVKRLKGDVLEVRQPSDLIHAIKHMSPGTVQQKATRQADRSAGDSATAALRH